MYNLTVETVLDGNRRKALLERTMRMAVTIKDVSAKCGLSISTVSKAFNDYGDISLETKEFVKRTAREIGYYPNATARTLKTNRSYNLGVLFVDEKMSGLTHPFFAAVLNAFKEEAESRGYDITFINHNIGKPAMRYLEHCRYRNVDGVCLACVDFYSEEVQELVKSSIPCVTIDHAFPDRPSVLSDNRAGIRMLLKHAYERGHRNFIYIHGQTNSRVSEERINSFRETMAQLGLTAGDESMLEGSYTDPKVTSDLIRTLLGKARLPVCILLPDDQCYIGALKAVHEEGMRIPEDVSVEGYDGIRLTQMLHPALTTIYQNTDEIGRQAAIRLISQIEHPDGHEEGSVTIPVRLIEGETVSVFPGKRIQPVDNSGCAV